MTVIAIMNRLLRNRSGVAMTEFALGAPLLLTAGLWGAETANYALMTMKVGQLAAHVADNASRIGDASTIQNRKIYETDILDVIYGAQLQARAPMKLYDRGRLIISSVQVNASGQQYIHWQRCRGSLNVNSAYGSEGTILPNGMGPAGAEVMAMPDDAVIFVELRYTYQPLVSSRFVSNPNIVSIASFTVRDDRDLTQIYLLQPGDIAYRQRCNLRRGDIRLNAAGRPI